jgi:hypothetical protein
MGKTCPDRVTPVSRWSEPLHRARVVPGMSYDRLIKLSSFFRSCCPRVTRLDAGRYEEDDRDDKAA